ncbi:alpha/beta fold hydrolase [Nocardia uniformis]|uniref:Alpha/beta fold hydrolase n=1 Tax=Nocardia uniformis TaxID=53432 RepID=A0A849CH55_9NOCA|nr:alpha/beta fold hydrolase [Nocardia uniformis]NNH75219.1 alpha/beta fold hydrolase [Nocardia uniformis]
MNALARFDTPPPIRRVGSGEPLLLVHGFTMNWQAWGAVIDELATEFDVLAVTLPGHWGGPPVTGSASVAGFADYLEQVMDEAGWATAHFAGNSLGGYLSFELGARGRARSITGIGVPGLWRIGGAVAASVSRKFKLMGYGLPLIPLTRLPIVAQLTRLSVLRMLSYRPTRVPAPLAAIAIESAAHCRCYHEFLAQSATDIGNSADDVGGNILERVTAPTTVVFCEYDRIVPPRPSSARMVTGLPKVRSRTLSGVGHVPMLEAPAQVAAEIRSTIRFAQSGGDASQLG